MPQSDVWKRYLEAGVEFTQMSRQRAEAVVKDLVKAGEVQREQAQDWVEDLLDKSRRNTEAVLEMVRNEVREQLEARGVVSKKAPAKKAATTAPAKKASATKQSTKKASTTKSAATKAPAKKASATKQSTKKASTTKSAAKKTTAKKAASTD